MKDPNWQKCLLKADSREVIKRIPDNAIDFILTDPPYNIGKHSTGNIPLPGRTAMNNDVADWDWVDFHPEEWADEFIRILKPTGNLFIFTSYNQLGRWYECLDHKFDTSNFMIWHKTNPAPKIFKAGFLNSCEMIFTCWNKRHTWNFISQAEMHNFIESPICMRPERLSDPKHPAQKPVAILKKLLQIASNPGDIVFDPFMGVGSTGVAALDLGRRFIGVELDERYFAAAKKRIVSMTKPLNSEQAMLSEPCAEYGARANIFPDFSFLDAADPNRSQDNITLLSIDSSFAAACKQETSRIASPLQPIIKWAGGKEKELKYILPNLPQIKRYFEPFVGGGAVYTAVDASSYHINDLSQELISLYKAISTDNSRFFKIARDIDASWEQATAFFAENAVLIDIYLSYRNGELSQNSLKDTIAAFVFEKALAIKDILDFQFADFYDVFMKELNVNLLRKMTRMLVLEKKKHLLPAADLLDNLETAVKSALYMTYRTCYNTVSIKDDEELHSALFMFIRNYSYSGMFRYNDKGEFNVPYGGIAYNSKTMEKKLAYYSSKLLRKRLRETEIFNMDFEAFLRQYSLNESDFVFLDPPYDSEFSTYAQNVFDKNDHRRLASFLLKECKAKWMLVIKNTDFIFELYNQPGINIKAFEKEYLVSFMNRNEKKVTHLMITNY